MFAILANDFDPDGRWCRRRSFSSRRRMHGSVSINPSTGLVTYSPDCEYAGSDLFTYTVRDNEGQVSNIATVNILLTEVQDAPTANDDTARTAANAPLDIDISSLLANDTLGDDGDSFNNASFAIPIGGQPRNGTATVNLGTGKVTYTPNPGLQRRGHLHLLHPG